MEVGGGTYKLHLMLDTEELLLRIHTSVGAVGKLSNELVPGDEVGVFLSQLIGKGTFDIVTGEGEVRLHERVFVGGTGLLDRRLAGGNDGNLATVTGAGVANQLR
jgi:hypothetical protein